MPARSNMKSTQIRERIAKEAARVMCEAGVRDFQLAKRKALQRLRIDEQRNLPSNEEIEAAVSEYQRLFRADTQPRRLAELRKAAVRAMRFLARFEPRLVGAVLGGTAVAFKDVPPGAQMWGNPAREMALELRIQAAMRRLPEMQRDLRAVKKKLEL